MGAGGRWVEGWPVFGAARGPLLWATVQPSSTYRASAGSMMALYHTVAKTNVLPLKCRQQSWCELCMYTNELCCRMLSWWLPSLLGIDPSRVKTGRKEEGDQQQQQQNSVAFYPGITPGSSRSFQRCSLKLWSLLWTLIWITSTYFFFFHWMNANPRMEMGIIHSCFCSGSFGSCSWEGSQRWVMSWQLMITKQSAPCPLRTYSTARCVLTELMKICQVNLIRWTWRLDLL